MPVARASFYVLPDSELEARDRLVCRLAEKAWQAGQQTLIWVADEERAQRLDQLLWTWKPASFLPHNLRQAGLDAPVEIATRWPDDAGAWPVVINLADQPPPANARVPRLIEIVIQAEPWRTQARERLKHYRRQGVEVDVNDLRRG